MSGIGDSNSPESKTDVLVLYTQFKGAIGVGLIIHIEPAGPFAISRAQAHAREFVDETIYGNCRLTTWIGEEVEAPAPEEGRFVLFDERYAAPWNYARQLVRLFERDLEPTNRQAHNIEL